MSTFVYVDPNRSQYGGALPPGYDGRTSRKPVQRRVVDFTSTVARNLQVRSPHMWRCCNVCGARPVVASPRTTQAV